MRYELLNKYRTQIENGELDQILLDNYNLDFDKNLYFKVNENLELVQISSESLPEDKEWIKNRDIFSQYINYNKRIGENNTMSNNLYTLFFKIDKIENNSLSIESIKKNYFDILKERELIIKKLNNDIKVKGISNFEKLLYKKMSFIEEEELQKIEETMLYAANHFFDLYSKENLEELQKDLTIKEYKSILDKKIKIFYDTNLENYNREIKKYLNVKLFNKLADCKIINDEIYGIPPINISQNSKKPFLENKTMNCNYGFYLNFEETFALYKLDLLFKTFKEKTKKDKIIYARNLYFENDIDKNSIENIINFKPDSFNLTATNLSTEYTKEGYFIKDYNVVTNFDKNIKTLDLINYMNITDKEKNILPNQRITFSGVEKGLYKFLNPTELNFELLDKKKLRLNYENIEKFLNTGNIIYIKDCYNKFFKTLLIDIYKSKKINIKYYTMELLNLKFSIKNYILGGYNLDIKLLQEKIIDKINNNVDLENDEEFLFLYGQAYYYLITKSEAKDKNLGLINLPLKSNSAIILKNDLKRKVQKFGYKINLYDKRIKTAINMLMRYEMKGQLNMLNNDNLYIGLTYDNLFYIKNEKEKENNEDEK